MLLSGRGMILPPRKWLSAHSSLSVNVVITQEAKSLFLKKITFIYL